MPTEPGEVAWNLMHIQPQLHGLTQDQAAECHMRNVLPKHLGSQQHISSLHVVMEPCNMNVDLHRCATINMLKPSKKQCGHTRHRHLLFLACSSKLVLSSSSWVLARASCRVPSSVLVLLKPTMMLSRCFSAAASFLSKSCDHKICLRGPRNVLLNAGIPTTRKGCCLQQQKL